MTVGHAEQGLSDIALERTRDEAVHFGLRIFAGHESVVRCTLSTIDNSATGYSPWILELDYEIRYATDE